MGWKLQTQTQEISMIDRLVHYARTHNCSATDAAQDMRDILKKSPALDDISKAQSILDAEKQEAEQKKMGKSGEFYNWRD